MKALNYLLFATLFFCFVPPMQAQSRTNQREVRIQSMQDKRLNFFTKELNLTPEERNAVGKVLSKLDDEKVALLREVRNKRKELMAKDNITQRELDDYLSLTYRNDVKRALANKRMHEELAKVLPPMKVMLIDNTLRSFARMYSISLGSNNAVIITSRLPFFIHSV